VVSKQEEDHEELGLMISRIGHNWEITVNWKELQRTRQFGTPWLVNLLLKKKTQEEEEDRLQQCLEWVLRVYTHIAHSRQCCNLLISWLWTHSVIVLPILVWRVRTLVCDDQSTVHTQLFAPLACCRVLLRVVTLLLRMKSFSVFCSEYSRARPSTPWVCRSFQDAPHGPISCARSIVTVTATARPICRTLWA